MNEKILTVLSALGFIVSPVGEISYTFKYDGLNYLYRLNDDGDGEGFLQMFVLTDINAKVCGPYDLYRLMDKTNDGIRYVKANLYDGYLCLFYENALFGYENYEVMLRNMINALEASFRFVYSELKDIQIVDGEFEELSESDDDSLGV